MPEPVPIPAPAPTKRVLGTADLAAMLGCTAWTLCQRNRDGFLPEPVCWSNRRLLQWSASEIDAWMLAGCPDRRDWERIKKTQRIEGRIPATKRLTA